MITAALLRISKTREIAQVNQAPTAGRLEREPEAGGAKRAMLYLTRKIGESVIITDNIEVTVVDIRGKSIKLGLTFPSDATVLRREIFERIQEENRAAAATDPEALNDAPGATVRSPSKATGTMSRAPIETAPPLEI